MPIHHYAAKNPTGAIVGLDKIGRFFGRSRWSIARWIKHQNFPATQLPDGTYVTMPSAIHDWLKVRKAIIKPKAKNAKL